MQSFRRLSSPLSDCCYMDHKLWAGCKCECVRALWCVARLSAMHLLCAHGISSPANDACVHRTQGRWVAVESGSILKIMKREPENKHTFDARACQKFVLRITTISAGLNSFKNELVILRVVECRQAYIGSHCICIMRPSACLERRPLMSPIRNSASCAVCTFTCN